MALTERSLSEAHANFCSNPFAERAALKIAKERRRQAEQKVAKEKHDQQRRAEISLPHAIAGIPGVLLREAHTADQALAAASEVYLEQQDRVIPVGDTISRANNREGLENNVRGILAGLAKTGDERRLAFDRGRVFLQRAAKIWEDTKGVSNLEVKAIQQTTAVVVYERVKV